MVKVGDIVIHLSARRLSIVSQVMFTDGSTPSFIVMSSPFYVTGTYHIGLHSFNYKIVEIR